MAELEITVFCFLFELFGTIFLAYMNPDTQFCLLKTRLNPLVSLLLKL